MARLGSSVCYMTKDSREREKKNIQFCIGVFIFCPCLWWSCFNEKKERSRRSPFMQRQIHFHQVGFWLTFSQFIRKKLQHWYHWLESEDELIFWTMKVRILFKWNSWWLISFIQVQHNRDNDQQDVYKTTAGQQCFQTSEILVSYSCIFIIFFFQFYDAP